MHLVYINPNSTAAMTEAIVKAARAALPGAVIEGLTNLDGPPAIQGPADGEAAVPGLLRLLPQARAAGADAIVIACFDDTGLDLSRRAVDCPVVGIGQSAYSMAALLGLRFSIVTSLEVSVPVIRANVAAQGFAGSCASIRASGLPVLTIDEGSEATRARLADEIACAKAQDAAEVVVLGCAGMAALADDLARRTGVRLIDGVTASAHLAAAAAGFARLSGSKEDGMAPADTNVVAHARATVERYLELSMVPDPEGAARHVAPGLRLVFTGGRLFGSPAESTAFNALRYKWVKKRFLRTDAALDPSTGEVRVFNTGYLYGEWPDGSPFETNRYIDIFTVRDGLIVETQVWNDSAEILLERAGLAEAPL